MHIRPVVRALPVAIALLAPTIMGCECTNTTDVDSGNTVGMDGSVEGGVRDAGRDADARATTDGAQADGTTVLPDGAPTDAILGGMDGASSTDTGTPIDMSTDMARMMGCRHLGMTCVHSSDCCDTGSACIGGVCEIGVCISDNQACTDNAQCCGGVCNVPAGTSGGTCTPLNPTCSTVGNSCTDGSTCCSTRCSAGVCSAPSYCAQNGDACRVGDDCCGGICTVAAGAMRGTCSAPPPGAANCTLVDGMVCGSLMTADGGGIPACGGACCSRLCAPYGPTGIPICQPASGCHVTGDICRHNSDCCGAVPPTIDAGPGVDAGDGTGVVCSIMAGNAVGTCQLPQGCQPNGNVCRTATTSCNARCDCCAGNCHGVPSTCNLDNLGIPRCGPSTCVAVGGSCATSADCCGGVPCVPGPTGALICYDAPCVPSTGSCTTSADCCPGGQCFSLPGAVGGTCMPPPPPPPPDAGPVDAGTDVGTDAPGIDAPGSDAQSTDAWTPPPVDMGVDAWTCHTFGQLCTVQSDCCAGLPCTPGWAGGSRCEPLPM